MAGAPEAQCPHLGYSTRTTRRGNTASGQSVVSEIDVRREAGGWAGSLVDKDPDIQTCGQQTGSLWATSLYDIIQFYEKLLCDVRIFLYELRIKIYEAEFTVQKGVFCTKQERKVEPLLTRQINFDRVMLKTLKGDTAVSCYV